MGDANQAFNSFVKYIFSSWTALKLALSHSTGGDDTEAKIDFLECNLLENIKNLRDPTDLELILEDYLDHELNTICEDNSLPVIANAIYWALERVRAQEIDLINARIAELPEPCDLSNCINQTEDDSTISESESEEVEKMDSELT